MPKTFPYFFSSRYKELIEKHFNVDCSLMIRFQIWLRRTNFYSIDGKTTNFELILPLDQSIRLVIVIRKKDLKYLYLLLGKYQKFIRAKNFIDAIRVLSNVIQYAKKHANAIYKEYSLEDHKVARVEL